MDETRLIRQMLRGDEDAFSTFIESYAPRLYRFTLTRVADEDATEEIVQATLVQATRKQHLFRGDAALFTWMVTLCRHEITDLLVPLAEGAGTYVESVTVKASAFEEAEVGVASQTVLGGRDLLALRGVLADDPQRAVPALPGVTTGDDFRAEFAVRGHGPQHLGPSVDGIDSRLLFHTVRGVENAGSIGLINSNILESVSVVAGARPQRMHASLGAAVCQRRS